MLRLLLLLSGLSIILSAVVTTEGDVKCPYLPCPLLPCKDRHATFYPYHGILCRGCDQCNQPLEECPEFDCIQPEPCAVPLQQNVVVVHGRECHGCFFCPAGHELSTTPDV